MSPRPTTRNWRGLRAPEASGRSDPQACGPAFERVVLADDGMQATPAAPSVQESLRQVALRLASDPSLAALELRAVEVEPCRAMVRLVFQPRNRGAGCCEFSALHRLRELRPVFRDALMAAGHPAEPLFEVRSWTTTEHEQVRAR